VKALHIANCILLSAYLCFGGIYEENIPVTENLCDRHALSRDTLWLRKGKEWLRKGIDFTESDYDSARVYLLRSARSADIPVKTESYLYLNFIETRLQNYDVALIYLEEYHKNAMLLFHRSLEIEDSVRNHRENIDSRIYSIDRQNRANLLLILLFSLIPAASIILMIRSQRKRPIPSPKEKTAGTEKPDPAIQTEKEAICSVNSNAYHLQAEMFRQTPIYAEIKELEKQHRDQYVRVLTYEKQDQLQRELDRFFGNFQEDLRRLDARLSRNDIKLCCLSLLPVNSFAKALCFGSTEINIIKQRKYYIKKKMTEESANTQLFDFIFSARKE
jgi:hypothetical protein